MNEYTFDTILKREFQELRDDNKRSWSISRDIYKIATDHAKAEVKAGKAEWERVQADKEAKIAAAKPESGNALNDEIQHFLDNPLNPEDESKFLRAYLHVGLSKGDVNPQLLEKIDKIIGINSGKSETISVVDFKDAYPDLAKAIDIASRPQPEGAN